MSWIGYLVLCSWRGHDPEVMWASSDGVAWFGACKRCGRGLSFKTGRAGNPPDVVDR